MFRRRRKPPSDVMATTHIASMLDELMGRNRNDINAKELNWTDPDVCKYFVVEFCPNDLFTNTKADLGPCGKIHDENLKRMYQEDSDTYKKSLYQDDFLKFCQRMLAELQSKIKRAKERLLLTQQNEERMLNAGGTGVTGGQNVEADEKIVLLSEKIAALVEEAEKAGTKGNVEEAQELLRLCDELKEERESLRRSVMPSGSFKEDYSVHQKAMEVCETCGAFLIVGDAQQRIDDHLLGKQHMGYSRLRNAIDKLMDERKKQREEREKEAEERRQKREVEDKKKDEKRRRSRSRSRDRKARRSRDRSSGRSRDRKKRSKSKERKHRSRSRSRNRKRSRSRDRRRSRSRDKRRRSRTRSRERRQRSKSRSKDRGRKRSRSRSRKRSRSRDKPRKSRSRSKERSKKSRSKSRDRSKKSRSKSRNRDDSGDRNATSRSVTPQSSSSPQNNGDRSP